MPRRKQQKNMNIYITALKSAFAAVALTVAAIMIFAFIVKENDIQDAGIDIFNQSVKISSMVIAAVFAARKLDEKFVRTAMISSAIYIAVCFCAFSLIQNTSFDFQVFLADMLLACGIGAGIGFLASKTGFIHKNAKNT